MRIDWSEYSRVHAGRSNLLIHLLAVPLFAGSFLTLVYHAVRGDWISALVAIVVAIGAMAMQGRGHRGEAEAPRPFSGPADFVSRWFTEQFYIFPAFVLSGRWWRQYRAAGDGSRYES